MRGRARLALAFACAFLCWGNSWGREPAGRIILIGGAKSEGPGRHDYPDGIRLLKAFLESSPDVRTIDGLRIEAYPDGWPKDPAALEGAATIVWYFDGLEKHPLLDATRRARFEKAMKRGAGLVALHQSSTVPADDTALELSRWLGAARFGMHDRVTEQLAIEPIAPAHPVSRGLERARYHDELFPTFRFAGDGRNVTPIMSGVIPGKTFPAAWTLERGDGGRSFAFSGAHYLLALDQPVVRRMVLNAILWTAGLEVPRDGVRSEAPDAALKLTQAALKAALPRKPAAQIDAPTFHRDAQRTGWNANESVLTPAKVAGRSFGPVWESPPLDAFEGEPPRLYASPLYVDRVKITAGPHHGGTFPSVFAATSTGFVYAIAAFKTGGVKPGTILWRTRLGTPCRLAPRPLDGVATGILATPVIDTARARLYVTSCEAGKGWQAFALDLGSGDIFRPWPVPLDEATFNALNRNSGNAPAAARAVDYRLQRGALNLSPEGGILYVAFGESATGWLVAVDTVKAEITSAFATVANPHRSSGGIWGAGGPAVDPKGNVFVVTGTNYGGFIDQPNDWVQSVLMLSHSSSQGLALRATYTPFNHCETATNDIDLGSGGVAILPDLDASASATNRLMAVGGKQGNVYLIDRERMPGRLDRRPACGADASVDGSLLPPENQAQFGKRGPLNVFGPYSETDGAMDVARARSVPAYFRDAQGTGHVFVTGNTRKESGSAFAVPPSLARLELVATPGQNAYLRIARLEPATVLENPGSPVITSNGYRDAIVWVLDENARRSASLAGADAPRPALYAFDAMTLKLLWKSAPGALHTSGKYNEPAFARGTVFVGTDRIQAFGLKP